MTLMVLFFILNLVRGLLVPLMKPILCFLNKEIKDRCALEKTFYGGSLKKEPSTTFHISSEGEFEQAYPLMKKMLDQKQGLQILFTSSSVYGKLKGLGELYPGLVLFAMLPALNFSLLNPLSRYRIGDQKWIRTPLLIMVRYDFFPELMLLGLHSTTRFILLSATLKGKDIENKKILFFYFKGLLSQFNFIFAATSRDEKRIASLIAKEKDVLAYEFRMPQVFSRSKEAPEFLSGYPWFDGLSKVLEKFPRKKRIILGSAWEIDLEILEDEGFRKALRKREYILFIAPHKLSVSFIDELVGKINSIDSSLSVQIFSGQQSINFDDHIIISKVPGILCETYSLFGQVYVGGGFGRSIHSVIEPFWGDNHIFIGPKTHRSTEYDFISEEMPSIIHIINKPRDFYTTMLEFQEKDTFKDQRLSIGRDITSRFEESLGGLGSVG